MVSGQEESNSLIAEARLGNSSRLGELLESFRPLLMRLAVRQVGAKLQVRQAKSDIIQETFLTASQNFSLFRGTTQREFRNWLIQVFHSRLNDGLRRHYASEGRRLGQDRSDLEELLADPNLSPSAVASLNEQTERLLRALLSLNEIDREIIFLRYTEQLSFGEISHRVRLPLANVWRRWSRSVDELRKRL